MTGNALLRTVKNIWSTLRVFYSCRFRPFFKSVHFSCSCCRRTLKFFINTPHFPTVVIALCVVATIFANATPSTPNGAGNWGNLWHLGTPEPAADAQPTAPTRQLTGFLLPGDSLCTSFRRCQVPESVGQQVIEALRGAIDFRELRPHDHYALQLDDQGELQQCTFESGPLNIHQITRQQDGSFSSQRLSVPLERRTVRISGKVTSSLYESFMSVANEEPRLIYVFADIFATKIDFNTETRSGDRFSMIFEKYFKNGEFVGYGRILAACYERVNDEPLEAFYYSRSNDTTGAYYNEKGEELGSFFIRSPVPMARVSSGFSMSRMHPLLHFSRPHQGIDLAAPTGTPVMAAADGRVRSMGWAGGFGKQLIVQHNNGYITFYNHLSAYRRGLTVGSRVTQKMVIGYVGATGLATGPHLDYRVELNGAFLDPFSLKSKPRTVLQGQDLARFRQQEEAVAQLTNDRTDPKVVKVDRVTIAPESKFTFL